MNAHRHPHAGFVAIGGTIAAATRIPTFVPALKIPVANARSFRGNHSATVLMQAGKFPASPRPNANRAVANPATELTAAWAIAAILQKNTESEKPFLVPNQSITRPATSKPIAYAV